MISLCIPAYKRPELLVRCLDSLRNTVDMEAEIIVNLDGSDEINEAILYTQYQEEKISKLILNNGKNRGVGRSFQNCIAVAEGDYIFKIDADIIFSQEKWLSNAIGALEKYEDVGSIGLFDYHFQDPNDNRFKPEFNVLEDRGDIKIVKDYVSSIYGFRAKHLNRYVQIHDDGLHQTFGKMALQHSVSNTAFGFGSVYVTIKPDGTAIKTKTYTQPLTFIK